MRLEPVELLADVGLGGQQRGFHVKARLVEAAGRVEQQANLVGDALADDRGLARRIGFGLRGQRLDPVEMPAEDRAERGALAAPRLFETGERSVKRRQDGAVRRRAGLVALQYL